MRTVVSAVAIACLAGTAHAQYTTPHVINSSGPIVSNLNGTTFVNHGLVGVGRMPSFLDAQGSTFGSVSSLTVAPGTWSFDAASGTYAGQFLTLPDRGRNDPASGNYVDYQGRVQKVDFSFKPLPAGSGSTQDQIKLNYRGLTLLSESNGAAMVGQDPGTGVGSAFGRAVPRIGGNGNIALDAEGLVATPDGGYYVSDEYGSAIYRFNAAGELQGVINPVEALMPRDASNNLNFGSNAAPAKGRRNNQGMEGLSVSPDGKYLFAMNQSGAVQDSAGNQANRRFTRVSVYDISQDATPNSPIGHYAVELPSYTSSGNGNPVDRTAAVSEIVAMSDTQFMLISRDSNGRGPGTALDPVYKSVLMADISGATNLINTPYANGYTPIATGGSLVSGITAAVTTESLNMLNLFDLDRFGLNIELDAAHPDGDMNTLSEKWEGLSLVPDLATADPTDYYLFIANDNDFITQNGVMKTYDGHVIEYHDAIENDTMFLAYKVTIIPAPGVGVLALGGVLTIARRRR